MRTGEDIGDIKVQQEISLSDGRVFRIILHDNTQVQVFGAKSGGKQIARRILGTYIDENALPIPDSQLAPRPRVKLSF